MRLQHRHCVFADPPLRQACRCGNLIHEIFDQFRNILAPLRERRYADRHDRQPVIEVFAEFSFGNLGFEIARRRGHDADIHADFRGSARALEGLIDEHAQNPVLGFARQIRDLIDEQRAAVRLF